jgi:hypothetical protein
MAAANALQYVLQLVASHTLDPAGFGAFGSVLGLALIGAVPMLALQTVTARHIALRRRDGIERGQEVRRLLRTAARFAAALSCLGLALSPLLSAFLHVSVLAVAWMVLSLGPLALVGTAQGVLQGRERFAALAVLFVAVSGLRVVGGVVGLLLAPGVTYGLAGATAGALLSCLLGLALVRGERAPGAGEVPAGFVRELAVAMSGVLALLVLAGEDLLLARHVLPGDDSGRYAAGSLVVRACFWLPQFVAVLVVPRLAAGDTLLARRSALLVGGLGLVEVLVATALPGSVLGLLLGDHYASLAGRLGLFAVEGACLAVLQLLLYSGIARGVSSVGRVLWGTAAVEALVVLLVRPGLTGIVLIAAGCAAVATAAALRATATARPRGTAVLA